ncbi:MAG: methyltransferase domain-containing protein [Steroidobacteraceae bacterium]
MSGPAVAGSADRAEAIRFVCPSCLGQLQSSPLRYDCVACALQFPVLHGIPDFRLRPDRYLTIDEERAKAAVLVEGACNRNRTPEGSGRFCAMLDHYYEITDDVPAHVVPRYRAYHTGRSREFATIADELAIEPGHRLLDAGCGTGGLLMAAAQRGAQAVGLDIALRWLVMCRQRLDETGVQATLVCADIEAPPFLPGLFDRIAAVDLLEHCHSLDAAVTSLSRQLKPKGRIWLSGANRYFPGPHAATGLWAVGLVPRAALARLGRALRGFDSLRHTHLVSPRQIMGLMEQHQLSLLNLRARPVELEDGQSYGGWRRLLVTGYGKLRRMRIAGRLLALVGPVFSILAEKRSRSAGHDLAKEGM